VSLLGILELKKELVL